MTFRHRTDETEIMDVQEIPSVELEEAYRDINRANKLLGGYRITIEAVIGLLNDHTGDIRVLDIGCGDGGMLRQLAEHLRKKGIKAQLCGLDLSEQAITLARNLSEAYPEICFVPGDIMDRSIDLPPATIVICTLTLHHIREENMAAFIKKCLSYTENGLVINDLQRHKAAYYLFKLFSTIYIRSPIARNDGLVSVKRGFLKKDLLELSVQFPNWEHSIKWKWAFRYVWVLKNNRLIHA